MVKRILLKDNRQKKKKRKIERVTLEIKKGFMRADIARGVVNFFKDFPRMGCTNWVVEGRYVELYDLNDPDCIGAIYPDGACMVWPISWFYAREADGKIFDCKSDITYSVLARKKESVKIIRRRKEKIALKARRVALKNKCEFHKIKRVRLIKNV